jgi:cysteine desulfurase
MAVVSSEKPIYLDHNATTPVDPLVIKEILPFLEKEFGNPSSGYPMGLRAKRGVERARKEVASLLGCEPHEVIFTSGGSESNNTALKGLIDFKNPKNCHLITSSVEHPAITNPALFLSELGVRVTFLPVDHFGLVDPDDVRKAILPQTTLISIMQANNETGTLQPIQEISNLAREHGIPFHTDAAQMIGKLPVDVNQLGVDLLSIAGHKLYAPKGVGALYVRKGLECHPLIHGAAQEQGKRAGTENTVLVVALHGAAQEQGKRAGTENTVLVVALGAACRIAKENLEEDSRKMRMMRDQLQNLLFSELDGVVLNGHPEKRLPNTLNISVPGLEGGRILEGLPEIMASTGAACHDRTVRLSHVLSAMGVPPEIGMGALRLTVGRSNTAGQVERAGQVLVNQVKRMR